MSTLQVLDTRPQPTGESELNEIDAALEEKWNQSSRASATYEAPVFLSRYRPQTFASVEELVARDIEAFTLRRSRVG